jgi:glucose-6-phosphate-specific signal transduction histidine kinase
MFFLGWWIPVVPALLALLINGAGLTASLFYRYQQDLRFRLQDRQFIIERTFDVIHNGPLQILARISRRSQEENLSSQQLSNDLQHLDREMRSVYEFIRRETLTQGGYFYLENNLELDLNIPLHEVLYEIYSNITTKDFPGFKTLKIRVTKFESIDNNFLSIEQKQNICRFFEEALCNVGKHALEMSRLEVICCQENGQNIIRVVDNGINLNSNNSNARSLASQGRGTQQANNLARQLGGKFRRSHRYPRGTVCELTWTKTQAWFWFF